MPFTAGALVAAAVSRLQLTDRGRRAAGWASVLLIAGVVAFLYWSDAHPLHGVTDTGGLVDILFVPLVMALAAGTGSLPALLSIRPMVYGGPISFFLYMVYELGHTPWILDGPAVRAHDGRQRRQTAAGRSARGDLRRRGRAVSRRRGARPSLDAQDGRRWPARGRCC